MAVSAIALTTLATLKSELGITVSTYDTRLESIIDSVSQWIETQTGRKLKARRYNGGASTHATTSVADEDYVLFSGTQIQDGGDTLVEQGKGILYLPQYPVQANAVLTFTLEPLVSRSSAGEAWDTALVEWQDYIIERDKGKLILLAGAFGLGYRNYRITMAAGYQSGAAQPYVPKDLEWLCIELARGIYTNDRNILSESIGTWSRSYSVTLKQDDPFVRDTLDKYSRLSL